MGQVPGLRDLLGICAYTYAVSSSAKGPSVGLIELLLLWEGFPYQLRRAFQWDELLMFVLPWHKAPHGLLCGLN